MRSLVVVAVNLRREARCSPSARDLRAVPAFVQAPVADVGVVLDGDRAIRFLLAEKSFGLPSHLLGAGLPFAEDVGRRLSSGPRSTPPATWKLVIFFLLL